MNKKLLLLVVSVVFAMSAIAQNGFTVCGVIEGMPDSDLMLVVPGEGKLDTLDYVTTYNGRFEFTGSVPNLRAGYIMTQDQKGIIPLMLENADFEVYYGIEGAVITGGGKAQDLFNRYNALNKRIENEQKRLEELYKTPPEEGSQMNPKIIEQQFIKFMKKVQDEELELINANNDDYVTAYVLASSIQRMSHEDFMIRYKILGQNALNTSFGKLISMMAAQIEQVSVGGVLSDFTVTTPDGDPISLSSLNGKVKIIDFWASWCAPCRQKNAEMVKLYKTYRPKGLDMISVSLDDNRDNWIKAIKDDGLTWKHGSDLLGQRSPLSKQFMIQGIPLVFVLDQNNRIVGKNMTLKELKKTIDELLAE